MVSEPSSSKTLSLEEPKLSFQSFHQCSSLISIQLSSTNFLIWKSQILPLIRSLGLEHHITNSEKPADEVIDSAGIQTKNPKKEQWILNDGLLTSWLLANMKEETIVKIDGGDTAYSIWKSVHDQLLPNTEDAEAQFKNSIYSLSKGNLSLDEYIRKFKEICNKLAAIGKPLSDVDKVFQVSKGLGNKYKEFRIAVLSKPPYPSFNQFVMSLQNFEQVYLVEETSSIDHNQAFFGQRGRGRTMRGGRGKGRGRGSNSFSQTRPNYSNNNNQASNSTAPSKNRPNYNIGKNQGKGDCQICGRTNHTAVTCYYRYDYANEEETAQEALAAMNLSGNNDPNFYADSGATAHMTNQGGNLKYLKPYYGTDHIFVGNGQALPITYTGNALFNTSHGKLALKNVLVVPKIKKNLLSVSKLIDDNACSFEFNSSGFVIKDSKQQIVAKGHRQGNLFALEEGKIEALAAVNAKGVSSDIWHARLGHPNYAFLKSLENKKVINVTKWLTKDTICTSCQLGKRCKLSFNKSESISKFPLQKIHSDLWGPAPTVSSQKFQYYVIFIDDFTRYTWLYPLKYKSEFYSCFLKFQAFAENHFDRKIKTFQCDGGGEFTSNDFKNHLTQCGIKQHISCPHTPEQNGLAERKHRHIVETGLTLLFHANVPLKFWVDAFLTATYLINRLPLSSIGKDTPYFKLFGKHANYSGLRIFGSQCFPYLKTPSVHKFSKKTVPCVFLGYSPLHKGYRCLDPQSHRVYISRHVVFNETCFPFLNKEPSSLSQEFSITTFPNFDEWFSGKLKEESLKSTLPPSNSKKPCQVDLDLIPPESPKFPINLTTLPITIISPENSPSPITHSPISPLTSSTQESDTLVVDLPPPPSPPQRPQRDRHPPSYLQDYICPTTTPHNALLVSIDEPKTLKTALKFQNWKEAMQEEIDALHKNKTWTLVPRPINTNVVGSKWVYRTKFKEDGNIDRFKARLVAKGYTQIPGLDFGETFSPVVKATTIRVVLSLAVHFQWPLRQLDVKNAFLNGVLHERVFMEQPPGFVNSKYPHHVCFLQKSLYGLKQAPRAWFSKLSSTLISLGFICSKADHSLFIYRSKARLILLLVYADDVVLTGNDSSFIAHLITRLNKEFSLKDLGNLHYFLGLEVKRFPYGIFLSQAKYAHDLLAKAQMLDATKINTPIAQKPSPLPNDTRPTDPTNYRQLCGSLQYLTFSRPDLTHAVNLVCQHFQNPTMKDLRAVKRILRYIKGTLTYGVRYLSQSSLTLNAFCDADWAGCPTTRRSTTGFCIFLGSNCITWASKKQPTVSRSSTEAEYRALATTAVDITWLQHLLHDIGITLERRPLLLCDNKSAIHLSSNPVFHARTKHIEIDGHFIREKVTAGNLCLRYLPTSKQIADVLTKALPREQFEDFRYKLGVHSPSLPSLREGERIPQSQTTLQGENHAHLLEHNQISTRK